MQDNEYVQVPVLQSFDGTKVIGFLRILKEHLPDTPNFVFTLAYKALEVSNERGAIPNKPYLGKYELEALSPIADKAYAEYLKQIGII